MKYLFPLSPYNQQRQFQKPVWVYPVHLAMYATYLRNMGNEVIWDSPFTVPQKNTIRVENDSQIMVPFNQLPAPDRVFTDAMNKRWQGYGNYKYHPATHMMSAFGCWHGKCSFCHENGKDYITRDPMAVAEEVYNCYELGFKEIFDDAATLPSDEWMNYFYLALNYYDVVGKIKLGCNLRFNSDNDFKMMKRHGYRMVLFGLESANQETLDRINKGINLKDVEHTLIMASKAGLEPHITVMFGYPWETKADSLRTVKLVHRLLTRGYAKTVQASVFSLPRTAPNPSDDNQRYVSMVYDIYKNPLYWFQKVKDIKRLEDVVYLLKRLNLIKGAK